MLSLQVFCFVSMAGSCVGVPFCLLKFSSSTSSSNNPKKAAVCLVACTRHRGPAHSFRTEPHFCFEFDRAKHYGCSELLRACMLLAADCSLLLLAAAACCCCLLLLLLTACRCCCCCLQAADGGLAQKTPPSPRTAIRSHISLLPLSPPPISPPHPPLSLNVFSWRSRRR